MDKQFVNPNWHVVLLHYPIALLFAGVLIELFSFLGWRRGGFRAAGRWMILLGTLLALPTALLGVYALNDVVHMGMDPNATADSWREVLQASPLVHDHEAWDHMRDHAWLNVWASAVLLLVVVVWLGSSDRWRVSLHVPLVVILLVGVGLIGAAAWHGGEAVYSHGVAVSPKSEANAHTSTTRAAGAATQPLASTIEFYVPPLQAHVMLAGITVALASVGIGLAFRQATQPLAPVAGDDLAAALGSAPEGDEAFLPSEQRMTLATLSRRAGVPPARFWMLAVLTGLITAGLGAWVLAIPLESWDARTLWKAVSDWELQNPNGAFHITRRLAHVAGGVSIVVLALILAMLGRWAPRQKFVLSLFVLLLLGVVAAQIWLGVLMLFDTNSGPITKYN